MIQPLFEQFNNTYQITKRPCPQLPTEKEATLLVNLIHEELMELNEALDNNDIVGVADALADIIYVTGQQTVKLGFPLDEMLQEVQRSNMSKLGEDGKPIFREDGKVLKGPYFSEPNLKRILENKGATCG